MKVQTIGLLSAVAVLSLFAALPGRGQVQPPENPEIQPQVIEDEPEAAPSPQASGASLVPVPDQRGGEGEKSVQTGESRVAAPTLSEVLKAAEEFRAEVAARRAKMTEDEILLDIGKFPTEEDSALYDQIIKRREQEREAANRANWPNVWNQPPVINMGIVEYGYPVKKPATPEMSEVFEWLKRTGFPNPDLIAEMNTWLQRWMTPQMRLSQVDIMIAEDAKKREDGRIEVTIFYLPRCRHEDYDFREIIFGAARERWIIGPDGDSERIAKNKEFAGISGMTGTKDLFDLSGAPRPAPVQAEQ